MTFQEFYQYVKGEKELLKKAKSSEKYGHTSTSAINQKYVFCLQP